MQSSPPTRAHLRPTSPTASEYSLDLNALGSDGDTETSIPKPRVDRVLSEDIDGPSDFTQNMDMWMRGGSLKKKTKKNNDNDADHANASSQIQTQTQPMSVQNDRYNAQEQYGDSVEEEGGDVEQSLQSLLHVPPASHEDEGGSAGNHTPENTPPRVSAMENDDNQFSSEWHTYGGTSTPIPPVHKHFLQPTVEDHHSEPIPARPTPGHTVRSRPTRSFHDLPSPGDHETTLGRASSPMLSPVRSPVLQRQTSGQANAHNEERHHLESQLRELQARCDQLEHLNSVLKNALDEESRTRRQEKVDYDTQMKEVARRERDLTELKGAAYEHNDDFRRQFVEVNEELRTTKKKSQEREILAGSGTQEIARKHATEIEHLRELMSRETLEHKHELQVLKGELELARRNTDTVEATSRLHQEDLENQWEDHDVELERMQAELQNEREDEGAVAELERLLEIANVELRRLTESNDETKEEIQIIKGLMFEYKRDSDEKATKIAAERSRAVEFAAGLQRQVHDLKVQLKDAHASHGEEVQRLKAAHGQGSDTSTQELDIVRRELDAKQNELNEAILERDEAADELEISKADQEELRTQIEDLEGMNVELDARISKAVRRREEVWRKKLEKADEERKLMVKTLMHQWGHAELGKETPQRYAYKYGSCPPKG